MRNCPQCNARVSEHAAFCMYCGTRLPTDSSAVPSPSSPHGNVTPASSIPQHPSNAYPPSIPPPSYQYPTAMTYQQPPGTIIHSGMPMTTTTRKAPMIGKTYVLLILLGMRFFFTFLLLDDLFTLFFLILYGVALVLVLMRHPWGGLTATTVGGLDIAVVILVVLLYPETLAYMLGALIVDVIIAVIGYQEYQECNKYQKASTMTTNYPKFTYPTSASDTTIINNVSLISDAPRSSIIEETEDKRNFQNSVEVVKPPQNETKEKSPQHLEKGYQAPSPATVFSSNYQPLPIKEIQEDLKKALSMHGFVNLKEYGSTHSHDLSTLMRTVDELIESRKLRVKGGKVHRLGYIVTTLDERALLKMLHHLSVEVKDITDILENDAEAALEDKEFLKKLQETMQLLQGLQEISQTLELSLLDDAVKNWRIKIQQLIVRK